MEILNDLTDGKADRLRELVDLFFKQTSQQLGATGSRRARETKRRCPPRGAQLRRRERHAGMTRFVPLLRKLERQGASGMLTSGHAGYEDTAREFKLIQIF